MYSKPIYKSYSRGPVTPWGNADACYTFNNGIKRYITPRHGGFYVPKSLRSCLVPFDLKALSDDGNLGWYEEDCEALKVYMAFPDLLEHPEDLEQVRRSYERCFDSLGNYRSVESEAI